MLTDSLDAASAAFVVGYKSAGSFQLQPEFEPTDLLCRHESGVRKQTRVSNWLVYTHFARPAWEPLKTAD